jgi:hypothetical protein
MNNDTRRPVPLACERCGATFPIPPAGGGASGYGYDATNDTFLCYACCADDDRAAMVRDGKLGLYLTHRISDKPDRIVEYTVTNWPGSLRFPVTYHRAWRGRGFGGGYPVELAHFTGPDGKTWSIRVAGNSQCGTARRLK